MIRRTTAGDVSERGISLREIGLDRVAALSPDRVVLRADLNGPADPIPPLRSNGTGQIMLREPDQVLDDDPPTNT